MKGKGESEQIKGARAGRREIGTLGSLKKKKQTKSNLKFGPFRKEKPSSERACQRNLEGTED